MGGGTSNTIFLTNIPTPTDLADDKRAEAKEAEAKANQLRAEANDLDFLFKVMKACGVERER